jgi:hypothetical protein
MNNLVVRIYLGLIPRRILCLITLVKDKINITTSTTHPYLIIGQAADLCKTAIVTIYYLVLEDNANKFELC